MIARYFISAKCFFYTWIDKVKIKKHQQGQTIYLPKKLSESTSNEAKEDILRHLKPLKTRTNYIPDFQDTERGALYIQIDNIRDVQQVQDLIGGDEFNQALTRQLAIENEIARLTLLTRTKPDDLNIQYRLALLYIKLKKYSEAFVVLGMLVHLHNRLDAKILGNIITVKQEILDELRKYQFVYYLKWRQDTPHGTNLKIRVLFDAGNRECILTEYDERGVVLPIQDFKQFKVTVAFESDGRNTPTLYTDGFYLMMGLLDGEGKLLHEFGEIVADIGRGRNIGDTSPIPLNPV